MNKEKETKTKIIKRPGNIHRNIKKTLHKDTSENNKLNFIDRIHCTLIVSFYMMLLQRQNNIEINAY